MKLLAVLMSLLLTIATFPLTLAILGGGGDDETQAAGLNESNVPAEYVQWILKAGQICEEITAPLLAAQIETESGWNPRAVSPAGAAGLTQFMPGTWAAAGVDGDGDGKADIYNPADAIMSQGTYMCNQVSALKNYIQQGRVSGDLVELALAAYNAGIGNVLKYGGVPPFAETQNYVKKIPALAASKYAQVGMPLGVGAAGGPMGNDYPYANGPYGEINWNTRYAYGNCTDFAFWRVNRDMGVKFAGANTQWKYTWATLTPLGGHGGQWGLDGNMPGWIKVPSMRQVRPGDIISYRPGAFGYHPSYGHVAYIAAVDASGNITIENYGTNEYFVTTMLATVGDAAIQNGSIVIKHNPALG